jgi:hypothetical protein
MSRRETACISEHAKISFGTFLPLWYVWTKKNLATLVGLWKFRNRVLFLKPGIMPWRRGAMDIECASGTRRPRFESRQGIRFLGNIAMLNMHCLCVESRNKGIGHKKKF